MGDNESTMDVGVPPTLSSRILRWIFPIIGWSRQLSWRTVQTDVIAGIVVGVILIPAALLFSTVLMVDVRVGLITALLASISYGLFGNVPVMSIGPVAELTTILLSLKDVPNEQRASAIAAVALQGGVLAITLSLLRWGSALQTVLAKTVSDAYAAGAAMLLIAIEINTMFNVPAPHAAVLHEALYNNITAIVTNWSSKALASFLLFSLYASYLTATTFFFRTPFWFPNQLFVILAASVITYAFRLDERLGLEIIRDIPSGVPIPSPPVLSNFADTTQLSAVVMIVGFLQICAIAKKVTPQLDVNQELFSHGMANLLVGMFGGMPTSTSLGRSSVLMQLKAKTPLSSLVAFLLCLMTVMYLTKWGLFYYVPLHALTAIILVAVSGLIDVRMARKLWKTNRIDAIVWMVTFGTTLLQGVTLGVVVGILVALVLVLLRVARPAAPVLGASTHRMVEWRTVVLDPELLVMPRILVWRFDAPLFFVNVDYFEQRLIAALRAEGRPIEAVVVDCGAMSEIDTTVTGRLAALLKTVSRCYGRPLAFFFANGGEVIDDILSTALGDGVWFASIGEAVRAAQDKLHIEDREGLPAISYVAQEVSVRRGVPLKVIFQRIQKQLSLRTSAESRPLLRRVRAVVAIFCHGDRTPKQKLKAKVVQHDVVVLEEYVSSENSDAAARRIVERIFPTVHLEPQADVLRHIYSLIHSSTAVTLQLKPLSRGVVVVCKWGGTLTEVGLRNAHELGSTMRARLIASSDISNDTLSEWCSRAHLKVSSPIESRVWQTALATAESFTGGTDFEVTQRDTMLGHRTSRINEATLVEVLSRVLHVDSLRECRRLLHIPGMRAVVRQERGHSTISPLQRLRDVHRLMEELVAASSSCPSHDRLANFEDVKGFTQRWHELAAAFRFRPLLDHHSERAARYEYDVSKLSAIAEAVAYDRSANVDYWTFHCTSVESILRELSALSFCLQEVTSTLLSGTTTSDRFINGALESAPLLQDVLNQFHSVVKGGPEHIHLYFGQYSVVQGIQNCLLWNSILEKLAAPVRSQSVQGSMMHVVLKLCEDSSAGMVVEVFMSHGTGESFTTSRHTIPMVKVHQGVPLCDFEAIVEEAASTAASFSGQSMSEALTAVQVASRDVMLLEDLRQEAEESLGI